MKKIWKLTVFVLSIGTGNALAREFICPLEIEVTFTIKNIPERFEPEFLSQKEVLERMSLHHRRPTRLNIHKPHHFNGRSVIYKPNGGDAYLLCRYRSSNIVTKLYNPKACIFTLNKAVCSY